MVGRCPLARNRSIDPKETSMTFSQRLASVAATALLTLSALANDTPPANPWDQTVLTDDIRADFAHLYTGLKSAHADLFAQRPKREYDARYQTMLNTFDRPMRRFDVQMAFQRFAAYGNVGHARIEFPDAAYAAFRDNGGKTLAIYPRVVDNVAYVGDTYLGDQRVRVGDEIVAIDGTPVSAWLERAAEHISADTPYMAHSLMEFTFPRDLWAVIGEKDSFKLTLRRAGTPFVITVDAVTSEEQSANAADTPAAFALESNARTARMLDDTIAYLSPGPFYNVENPAKAWDNAAFIAFVDSAFARFLDADAQHLIIDLRQNPGGDNSFSDAMIAWLADKPFRFFSKFLVRSSDEAAASNAARLDRAGDTSSVSAQFAERYARIPRGEVFNFDLPHATPRDGERFAGKVYALVNRHSFSNAVNVAAIIQDYGFGIVAGEQTADLATTYGSMERFTLPNTGFSVGFPKAHIIRPSGDPQPGGVTPDWVIASPLTPQPEDTVLNTLVEKIRSQ